MSTVRNHGNSNKRLEDLITNNYNGIVNEEFYDLKKKYCLDLLHGIKVVLNKEIFWMTDISFCPNVFKKTSESVDREDCVVSCGKVECCL
jgi:hypothetical protein